MVNHDKPICLGKKCSFNGQMLLQICGTLGTFEIQLSFGERKHLGQMTSDLVILEANPNLQLGGSLGRGGKQRVQSNNRRKPQKV